MPLLPLGEELSRHGIIHRDLKPANIKLRPDGAVKVPPPLVQN
jgi:serine/threonine protein kinase